MRVISMGLAILLILLMTFSIWAKDMELIDEDLVKIYQVRQGSDKEQIIQSASIDAVQQCVGRIYLSKNLIMARSLLEKYIERHYKTFVYSVETISTNYIGDEIKLEMYMYINYQELIRDLQEKRFLYTPRYKPYFSVFIDETLNGQSASTLIAQEEVLSVFRDRAVRTPETGLMYPPSNVDLTAEPELLAAAMREAHKAAVELLISGFSKTEKIKEEQLYYDYFFFYQSLIHLSLIRADTGEILYEVEYKSMAYDTDEQTAIKNSVIRAARDAANDIIDYYYETWDKIFLNAADYQLMISGIQQEGLDIIKHKLQLLNPETEIYVRSYYNNTAVLNIITPVSSKEIHELIRTSPYPNFRILEFSKEYLEAQKEY